jgi:hypothetical protein
MRLIVPALAAGMLLAADPVHAQRTDARGVPFYPWDANASIGLHLSTARDAGDLEPDTYDRDMEGTGAFGLDVGRYWTSHLKTEFGVQTRPGWTAYNSRPVQLETGQVVYATHTTDISITQVQFGGIWQFLENTFAHPYLGVGVRLGFVAAHEQRAPWAAVYDGRGFVTHDVPPYEARRNSLLVRPFVAGGFKSYFNERAFVRPEIATAFSADGASQWTLRVGFGVDF